MKKYFLKISRYKKILIGLFFLVVLVWPHTQAHAQLGIGSIASIAINEMVGESLALVQYMVAHMVSGVALALNGAVSLSMSATKDITVVNDSWGVMRDFANMFFIVALIIMAFATIFDVFPQYSFGRLIVDFVISALLINFSLVIGEFVIDVSQTLSNIFLTA